MKLHLSGPIWLRNPHPQPAYPTTRRTLWTAALVVAALTTGSSQPYWPGISPVHAQADRAWTQGEIEFESAMKAVTQALTDLSTHVETADQITTRLKGASGIGATAAAPAKIAELTTAVKQAEITGSKPNRTIGLEAKIETRVAQLTPGSTPKSGAKRQGGLLYERLKAAKAKLNVATVRAELKESFAEATKLLAESNDAGSLRTITTSARESAGNLRTAVDGVGGIVAKLPAKLATAAMPLAPLYNNDDNAPVAASSPDIWRTVLPKYGADFADLMTARRALPAETKKLVTALGLLTITGESPNDYPAFDKQAKAIYSVLPGGLLLLREEDAQRRQRAAAQLEKIGRDPDVGLPEATTLVELYRPSTENDEKVRVAVERLALEYAFPDLPNSIKVTAPYDLPAARAGFEETLRNLLVTLAQLDTTKAMSRRAWTEEYIRLYNTDRVDIVMDAIASGAKAYQKVTSDDAPSRAEVDKAAADSQEAAQSVVNQQQKVNDLRAVFRRRILELIAAKEAAAARRDEAEKVEDANRQARLSIAGLNATDQLAVDNQSAELKRLRALRAEAERLETQATQDRVGKEDNAGLKSAQDDARAKRAAAEVAVADAERDLDQKTAALTKGKSTRSAEETEATAKKESAKKALDAADDEVKTISGKMDQAETELQGASEDLGKASSHAYLLAMADNAVFGRARDNTPYYLLKPTSDQAGADPMSRAVVFGYPAERAILVRGSRDDVSRIRRLVNKLDRPQAQARLSLWTVEQTSASNTVGIQRLQESIQAMKDGITDINFQSADVITRFKTAVSQIVDVTTVAILQPSWSKTEFSPALNGTDDTFARCYQLASVPANGFPYQPSIEWQAEVLTSQPPSTKVEEREVTDELEVGRVRRQDPTDVVISEKRKPRSVRDILLKAINERESSGNSNDQAWQKILQERRASLEATVKIILKDINYETAPGFKQRLTTDPLESIVGQLASIEKELTVDPYSLPNKGMVVQRTATLKAFSGFDSAGESAELKSVIAALKIRISNIANEYALVTALERRSRASDTPSETNAPYQKLAEERLRKAINFFDPDVLAFLGVRPELITNGDDDLVWAVLPDPQSANSLAEAMVLLSLADAENQGKVFDRFLSLAQDAGVIERKTVDGNKDVARPREGDKSREAFRHLRAFLGGWTQGDSDISGKPATTPRNNEGRQGISTPSASKNRMDISDVIMLAALVKPGIEAAQHRQQQIRVGTPRADRWLRGAEMAGFQRELIGVLRRHSIDTFTDYLARLAARRTGAQDRLNRVKARAAEIDRILNGSATLPADTRVSLIEERITLTNDQASAEYDLFTLRSKMRTAAFWLFGGVGTLTPAEIERRIDLAAPEDIFKEVDDFLRNSPNYPQYANAHSANLDISLKRFMDAMDKDIAELIVTPRLQKLRAKIAQNQGNGYSVGIIQETNLLVSNRMVSRMDPSASASVVPSVTDVGGAEEALQLTGQLALLGAGMSSGGTAVPAIGALAKSVGISNLPNLSNLAGGGTVAGAGGNAPSASRSLPTGSSKQAISNTEEAKAELSPGVFAVTTGNVFQVTPIFDPTGQALRFKFDYVAASQIREPSGTIDPQLPRIVRNSVNTQVRLANQEIGVVAEYQSNAKLGLPSKREGGIPVLKELPILKEVPLIGWFAKRESVDPTTMYSLVFCRTSMYPGIEDVVDLISRPILRVGEYKQEPLQGP